MSSGMPKKVKKRASGAARSGNSPVGAGRQVWAVVTFFGAVLLFLFMVIPGVAFWNTLHSFLLGLFGLCSFLLPVLMGYLAVRAAMGMESGTLAMKSLQSALIMLLFSAVFDIFAGHGDSYAQHLINAFHAGASYSGGGIFGGLLGWPLYNWFGKAGSAIILIILLLVVVLLMTGTTLIQLFHSVSKPARKIHSDTKEALLRRQQAEEARKRSFDVSLDGMPENPTVPPKHNTEDLKTKQDRLIDTYHGVEPAEPEEASSDEPPIDIDKIIHQLQEPLHKSPEKKSPEADSAAAGKSENLSKASVSGITVDAAKTGEYHFPPITLLEVNNTEMEVDIGDELKQNAERLVETLRSFGVETRIINISRGPAVTRYELQPAAGVRINRITNLADDIALNLATAGVRIEAPIPNKSAVGIEVPNKNTASVRLRDIIDTPAFASAKSKLTVALGKDIAGNIITADLAKMPHLLIAGTTGSGKSVCVNSFIMSILYKATPDEVKFLMIDPKVVELGVYNGIPHLLVPVVTDPRKASGALGWAVTEMLRRYKVFAENNVKDLASYNAFAKRHDDLESMPQILIIIDELSDLMMAAPNEVEDSICRLAQMARAAGMHLVIATQRPSVDVVTGLIKANIPSRIALKVSNQIDSRTILDTSGADKLLGRGDMLFAPVGTNKPSRVQGCWVPENEIEAVVGFIKDKGESDYSSDVMTKIDEMAAAEKTKKGTVSAENDSDMDTDDMLIPAVECVVEAGMASTSLLQRKCKLGYARAARIMDMMEERGLIGPYEGSKPRKVLITKEQWYERKLSGIDENRPQDGE